MKTSYKTLLNFSIGRHRLQLILNKTGYHTFEHPGPYLFNTPIYFSRVVIDTEDENAPRDVKLTSFQVCFFYTVITYSRYTRLKDESTSEEA